MSRVGAPVVVPTFRRERVEAVLRDRAAIEAIGDLVLVCNSRQAAEVAGESGVRSIDLHENRGFGGGLNAGGRAVLGSGRGMLMLNDDVHVDASAAAAIRDRIDRSSGYELILFHAETLAGPVRPPGAAGTLARISGLWSFRRLIPRSWRPDTTPFYAAYVDWDLWRDLGGFDVDRYPLYFEDSDLLRRSLTLGAALVPVAVGVAPATSGTSRHYPRTVAAFAQGGTNYLVHHCAWPRLAAVCAVRGALVVRAVWAAAAGRWDAARATAALLVRPTAEWDTGLPPYA